MYNISDTTPLIWRIIHGMAVIKKKLAESRECEAINIPVSVSKFQRVSTTGQCHLGLLLASAFRLPVGLLYQDYQRVQFYLENVGPYRCNRNSAISERKSCSLPYTPGTRSGCNHREAPTGDYFNGILNTDLPDLRLIVPNIRYVTHQSKWRDLRTLIDKVFRFFFTNKPLTLKM